VPGCVAGCVMKDELNALGAGGAGGGGGGGEAGYWKCWLLFEGGICEEVQRGAWGCEH